MPLSFLKGFYVNKEDLIRALKPFTNEVQGGVIPRCRCIRNHFALILALRGKGVGLALIKEISGINVSLHIFSVKLSQAKKKFGMEPVHHEQLKQNPMKKKEVGGKNFAQSDYLDWVDVLNFKNNYNVQALKLVIPDLLKAGWDVNNYYLLRDKYEIMTFEQLVKVAGVMEASKFRKNIIKGGVPCF